MLPLPKTVIIICGPTAVGKTATSIQLAKYFQTQIISADSRQCFRELNIGVAKPSAEELNSVPHHFINSHSIHDEVNAAVFESYALKAADDIFKSNDVAIMVGGTGLYIKAFCEGLDHIPTTPAELREEINNNYKTRGLDWLQSEVQQKDLAYWQTGEQRNPHRLLRALEVVTSTGKSINDFKIGSKAQRPFNIIKIGIELSKEKLHENINNRVDKMIADGLVDEVKELVRYQNIKALQTVGYTEIFQFLNHEISLQQAIINIKTNTRQYAKRQMTWFKKDAVEWFVNTESLSDNIIAYVKNKMQ